MISSDVLNPLILSAYTGQITWLEASSQHPLDEFIETFFSMRERTHERLDGLSNAQAAFVSDIHPFWSISESITHLIHTQGFYHNKLLDISTSQLAHVVEAAKGFGEGARQHVPVRDLIVSLTAATERIRVVIEATRHTHDPEKTERNPAFGVCNYRTWILLLLAHEADHLRQIAAMRSVAKTNA
ncbi:MAG: DinB family protein [Anaerolineales bacterium]|nr:DinB family protein [Anaerolineales bacterium]